MLVIPARVKVVVVMVCALALAAGLLTLASLAKPALAQAVQGTDTVREPFNGTVVSCPVEDVIIQGTVFVVAHTTIDANGVRHTEFQRHVQGQGEGASSGAQYVFNDRFNSHENVETAGENTNRTETYTTKLIRQGSTTSTDDANLRLVIHVTINEHGEVTADVVNFYSECM